MIKLAYDNPFPPLAFSEKGRAKGAVIDVLSWVFARIRVKARFIPVPMEEISDILADGLVDGIAFYGVTPERRFLFDFSNPFLVTGAALFASASAPAPSSLAVREVGTIATPETGPLAVQIRKKAPNVRLLLVRDYREALEVVLEGKASVAALNMHVGRDLADKLFPGRFSVAENPFLEMPLAVAMPRGKNAPLLAAISRALGDFKRSAAYGVVLEKWLHGLHGPL